MPQNAVLFLRIAFIQMMIRSFHEPIDLIFKSVGQLKGYQLISLCTQSLMLPITFCILKSGYPIYCVFVNMCISELIELILIVILASKYGLKLDKYLKHTISPIILTTCASIVSAGIITGISSMHFIYNIILVDIMILVCISIFGVKSEEKEMIKQLI